MWTNFNEYEVVNPFFDGNPASRWNEQPVEIQGRLYHTMDLVQAIRDYMGKPFMITSTWRPRRRGSAHTVGKAVDFQIVNGTDADYLKAMNWLAKECNIPGFRAFLEWQGRRPWIHVDRGYKDRGQRVFRVGYPKHGKMLYAPYEGRLPQSYAQ